MTQEEAISVIKTEIGQFIIDEKWKNALALAISALEKQDVPDTNVGDLISRQAAIDAILAVTGNSSVRELYEHVQEHGLSEMWSGGVNAAIDTIIAVPSAQPDIIRCNACKHWTQTTGNMPGFGLGDCDYLNAKLVSCNGFCYWAERRTDE